MEILESVSRSKRLYPRKSTYPIAAQLELTYRCNFSCVYCYCKGSEDKDRELSVSRWKDILDQLQRAGCLWLGFTGGDPFVRQDFPELYSYAKRKGFLITILTNGYALGKAVISFLAKSPPYSIEITVNSLKSRTYETITGRKGSFARVRENLRLLKRSGLLFYIKANCLTLNRDEIAAIKQWADTFAGRPAAGRYRFGLDTGIHPRLNGDTSPCAYRLHPEELARIFAQDPDLRREYRDFLSCAFPRLPRPAQYLYSCTSWKKNFVIDPYGRLKICQFIDRFSADLTRTPFEKGFYEILPRVTRERFKTDSPCRRCALRPICSTCPAKARLETGDEEAPVSYYCALACFTLRQDKAFKHGKKII